ncbi:LysR family transcriptional regulator [Sphingobium nicotianae]|uniref:LysR family transcriptional regulator n=1 Tax=Sphingobium nicotianae TaxID=2782607 RepID=A0A9X1DDB3_9SPHN|nr:LysR family transcriptional regulator [Sphingobium nicotianae]MBT2187789.1 LysR family transcriptional regulator [Sphingobium nicotianae]
MRPFDWDDLRYFLSVAQSGTVSQAARRLGVDHATIIRRIDALERAMGVKLFERTPRGYYLTVNGERLLPSAEAIHTEARKIGTEMLASSHGVGGIVRISTLEGFGNFFLAGRLPKFAEQYPNLTIELLTLQQIVALSRREADIAISLQPPEVGRFVREKLTDYALFVYGSRDYLAGKPPIRVREDLHDHIFCGYIDDLVFVRELNYLDEIAKGIRAKLQSSSLHAQTEAAIAGYGLCVLPAYIAARYDELVPVLPDELHLRRSYWLVIGADVAPSPRIQAVRRFIRAEVDAHQASFLGPLRRIENAE